MLLLLTPVAEASRVLSNVCDAPLVVVATVASVVGERRENGSIGTFATVYVDRLIVGPAVAQIQFRYRGGTIGLVGTSVSGEPRLLAGARYLLVFRTHPESPVLRLSSWSFAPEDIDLPPDDALHAAWDTMCADGPVYGASIDTLRGKLAASP